VPFEWRQIPHDGFPIHVRVGGPEDGRVVVLVHGLLISGDYLMPTAEYLARRYRVVVPDLPGSGRSPGPVRELDIDGLARALIAVLDGLGAADVHLVANSGGCSVIARVASERRDLVRTVTMLGPGPNPITSVLRQVVLFFLTGVFEPLTLPFHLIRAVLHHGLSRSLDATKNLFGYAIEPDLARIRAPVLVIRGRMDLITPARWAERIVKITGGRLQVLNAAHAVNYELPGRLALLLQAFWDGDLAERGAAAVRA
jgi:2-hydroxy-6-oxonona-2,4-dienedioate hydrolase